MSASMIWDRNAFTKIKRAVHRGLAKAAFHLQTEIKKELSKHNSNRAAGGRPSPPGQPPGLDTGTLRRSIQVDLSGLVKSRPSVRVGTNLVYARIHEFGGPIRGGFMPARPYLRPTLTKQNRIIIRIVNDEVQKGLREIKVV